MEKQELLRNLPSVDEILKSQHGIKWLEQYPKRYIIQAIRDIIAFKRDEILKGFFPDLVVDVLAQSIDMKIQELTSRSLRHVINATGIVIHTNLGRAPLSPEAVRNIVEVSEGFSNLEYDLVQGRRGERYDHVRQILKDITGAEDAIIVNNNAAAVLLCLSALAKDREVIVSRGELIEIGGFFRIPDIMFQSGAILKEVGTTNKTHLRDYTDNINEQTALLLKVHQSNYRMIGFTKEVTVDELVETGKDKNIPVMFDLGSGCFIDLSKYGIEGEPTVQGVVMKGVDVVTFSGDKLLGGPQAGIIVGKKMFIKKISRHPLTRALRIDKLTLSALEATLQQYADPERAKEDIPVLKKLLQKDDEILRLAKKIYKLIKKNIKDIEVSIEKDESQAGGGALPGVFLPTYVLRLRAERISPQTIESRLRKGQPPVIARIKDDSVVLDVRTVRDSEVRELVKAISNVF